MNYVLEKETISQKRRSLVFGKDVRSCGERNLPSLIAWQLLSLYWKDLLRFMYGREIARIY